MVSIIKTAIITIIISFISGLLLEYYKNLAPRILCKIGNGVHLVMNNKKICAYILTVRNISNKTIHEISLNIQGLQNNLKSGDAKITKGLKFDSSAKDNILDVSIPFLSKDDKFSVTLYVENQYGVYNKPVVTIRSPENFKEVDSVEQNGILALLFDIPKNISKVFSNTMKDNETPVSDKKGNFTNRASGAKKTRSNKLDKNKKVMIAIVSLILVISIGGVGGLYYKEISANEQTPDTKANVQKQSTNATESAGGTNKNTSEKGSISGTAKNTSEKGSINETNKNAGTKTSTSATNENADSKASTEGTTKNTDTKSSTDETTESKDTKTSASAATKNTDTKSSTDGTTGNTDTKTSTGGTTKNTDTKSSTSASTGNADTKASTGGTSGSTSN